MQRWIHIIILLTIPSLSVAQSLSSKGRFSVDFDRGCNPLTVNISKLDNFGTVTRQYYFFEGANITNDTTFTYDTPGFYEIVQVVGADNIGDKFDTLQIEVLESIKPFIQVTKCSGLEVTVQSLDSYYDSIRVYFGGADSVTLSPNETTSFIFSTNGQQTFGLKGFFDNADEVCTAFFEEIVPVSQLPTPSIEFASIKETCRDIYALTLTLDQYDTAVNYRARIVQGSTSTQLFDGFLDSTSLYFSDIPFSSGDYCIEVEAYDPCNSQNETGQDFCAEVSSLSLSPFENLYSTYTDTGIWVNLDPVLSGSFEIQRRFEGGEFELRTESTGSFLDPIGSMSRKYFYSIDYRDSCGAVLFSAETHPPHIDSELLNNNSYQVLLDQPINYLTSTPGISYEIGTEESQSSEQIKSSQFTLNLDASNGTPKQFLSAIYSYPENDLRSNTLILKYELVIYVPSAFTPNGDGLNDQLEFFGLPTSNATIRIYTKWGQLIFSSTEPENGWDGNINGSRAPEGTYLYEILFETTDGTLERQKGTFALINK